MAAHYFIGIKIPIFAANALVHARNSWQMDSHKRYTKSVDMHITLLFIGNDPHEEIEEAAKALAEIDHSPFELLINGVAAFGNPATPRIVFASVEESEELQSLQRKVKNAVMKFNLIPDTKPFVPHITLAAKWAGGRPIEQDWQIEPIAFKVDRFSVFRIAPGQTPKYIEEFTYHLKEGV